MKGLTTEQMIAWARRPGAGSNLAHGRRVHDAIEQERAFYLASRESPTGWSETYSYVEGLAICIGATALGEWARRCENRELLKLAQLGLPSGMGCK